VKYPFTQLPHLLTEQGTCMAFRLVPVDLESGLNPQGWALSLPTTVGRSSDLAVCIDDDSISRSHCQLIQGPDECLQVRDLGSLNGTYVNGERIRHIHSLVPGDTLQIGSVNLRVEYLSDTNPGMPLSGSKKVSTATTQPMKTIPKETFTMRVVEEPPRKWWEFWKS
jgi:pSer/pThr/pTyr-binding forkhead associated (FHA) protein